MIGLSFACTIASAIYLNPVNMYGMYTGRFLCGFMVGAISTPAILYQSETSPTHARGLIGSFQELAIAFGILFGGLINVGLAGWEDGWRISYGGNMVFSASMCACMYFLPESPRWLMAHGREEEALECVKKIRYEDEVEAEMMIMREVVKEETTHPSSNSSGSWSELMSTKELMSYRTPIAVLVLCLVPICTGISTVMILTPLIFGSFLSPEGAIAANLAVAATDFVANLLATFLLIDRAGRRTLLTMGSLLMALSLAFFAIFTSSLFDFKSDKSVAIALVCFLSFYIINFAYSWGPLSWIVPAEVLPQHLRGKGMTIASLANNIFTFVMHKMGPIMILEDNLALWGTFTVFAVMNAVVVLFILLCLPETNGVHLEDIEGVFRSFLSKSWYERMWLTKESPSDMICKDVDGTVDIEMVESEAKTEAA